MTATKSYTLKTAFHTWLEALSTSFNATYNTPSRPFVYVNTPELPEAPEYHCQNRQYHLQPQGIGIGDSISTANTLWLELPFKLTIEYNVDNDFDFTCGILEHDAELIVGKLALQAAATALNVMLIKNISSVIRYFGDTRRYRTAIVEINFTMVYENNPNA